MQARPVDIRRVEKSRALLRLLGEAFPLGIPVELWDGSVEMLGPHRRHERLRLHLRDPGLIPSLIRRPRLSTLLKGYAAGAIDLSGGTFLDAAALRPSEKPGKVLRRIGIARLAGALLPLAFAKGMAAGTGFDSQGRPLAREGTKQNVVHIPFHYDLSNQFYQLFLDARMVYTCAYFPEWHEDIDRAQADKLDMICRKLRLQPGESLLDIGCGWGALLIHAAKHYGVKGHGVTLSPAQIEEGRRRVEAAGVAHLVTLELKPYEAMEGQFDKIASIGMYEHVGFSAHATYFAAVNRLLKPGGLYLHHAITRRGRRSEKAFHRMRPEYKAMTAYIFPGGEVDHIGHSTMMLEAHGFEVHDIEGWRAHYARTCALWCRRLYARRDEAEAMIGPERTRIWLAYLAGVSLAFSRGSLAIFQTLASKKKREGDALALNVPPSRADLYR
ncbi:MAG: cyclopropane-fatty-acyl-phospholipid synthase family protein [Hyphomicrobiales bacterium]|nr:cyclopropane-fatty-acyl-phospholipid synthase family protein [Hyphomicrobiales bacterium]MCA2000110.1 cyclopropane-fatty-acyl-phospholipid synthase family protein [Hyphomicrobiales bacterium]